MTYKKFNKEEYNQEQENRKNLKPTKRQLLDVCLTQKGELSKCFNMFHTYSINNRIWLYMQMAHYNIPITPVKTLKGWNDLNRKVIKGATGLYLNEYKEFESKTEKELNPKTGKLEPKKIQYFKITKNHFAMAQTTGENADEKLNDYYKLNIDKILKKFNIKKIDFNILDGNVQGYAIHNTHEIAINPLDKQPLQTLLHEVAHIVLEHDKIELPHALREVEAEATNFIICSLVDDTQDLSSSRAYIQAYLKANKNDLPEKNCERIFKAVDDIIKAGK